MPLKMNLKSVKDRLKDETLDLSLCDLEEVPVREIAAVRKATHLDLSNNLLVSLPATFVTLRQIVKLDLSRNNLTEIPENFGEMKQLKHLDLYANQISRLPLSLGELKNLRWLDLKENPLTPAVASVAGPCSNSSECQACARNIVTYLSNVKLTIEEEKLRRLNAAAGQVSAANAESEGGSKKDTKKKKKKSADKENKKSVNGAKNGAKLSHDKTDGQERSGSAAVTNRQHTTRKQDKRGRSNHGTLWKMMMSTLLLTIVFVVLFLMFAILPVHYEQESGELFAYLETRTGMPVNALQKQSASAWKLTFQVATTWWKDTYNTINEAYKNYFN